MTDLNNYHTKNSFKVPVDYFKNFNNEIMDKLPLRTVEPVCEIEEHEPSRKRLWKKVLIWSTAAAILVGVVYTTSILTKEASQNQQGSTWIVNEHKHDHDSGTCLDETMAASYAEDFYLFIEDEAVHASFDEVLFTE